MSNNLLGSIAVHIFVDVFRLLLLLYKLCLMKECGRKHRDPLINGEPMVESRTKVTLVKVIASNPRCNGIACRRTMKLIPLGAWWL